MRVKLFLVIRGHCESIIQGLTRRRSRAALTLRTHARTLWY